jgi:aspartyl-tRNA(Asn)/glutamyl-tRNA(Gln) amidotransferase subunit A
MKTISEIKNAYKDKAVTVRQVVDMTLLNISKTNSDINAVLGLYSDEYIQSQIDKAEEMLANGSASDMTGVPIVLKDNLCVLGQRAGAASKILDNYIATYNAAVVEKLREAGAILIGRANMDEFAMGGSTENSAYGVTRNPIDRERVAGGSSGGSAASVAAGYVPVALGSDTGGSIRQPASLCGIWGLKPTYGSVSRHGLMAMGSSLDVIGTFANSVEDLETVFSTIKGKDVRDATSHDNVKFKEGNGKVIGVPRTFVDQDGVNSEVRESFYKSLEDLKSKGYTIKDIEIKNLDLSLAVYYILMTAEVSSNMGRYDGVRFGEHTAGESVNDSITRTRSDYLGDEVRRRIMLGTYVLSAGYYDAYYNKGIATRNALQDEFKKVFQEVDYIATPTSPITAWKIGEKSDPLSMYLADIFTVSANIVGVPAMSAPTDKDSAGLPIGIQFMCAWGREDALFDIGKDIE